MGLATLVKPFVGKIIGAGNVGRVEFLRNAESRDSSGGPFNGQRYRQRIFFDLLYHFPIKAIVETGTYHGTTTALFAATWLPVYTVESDPRHFSYSKMRFRGNRTHVHLHHGDSRSFLQRLSQDPAVAKEDVFFYLDAHWADDLPLREELEMVFSNWIRPIVMIDDFQTPQSGYEYDDYGPGKTLNLGYIAPVVRAHQLAVFFPAVDSSRETGRKRGSVVLCQETTGADIDRAITTLARNSSPLE